MQASYAPSLMRLKVHEGGYTNDARDPGGPTNWGVTIFDVRKYVKPNATAADVRALTWEQACIIYKARYWDALRCDELPAGVDDTVFDYGVNSGIGRSGKVLRRVLGLAADDWRVTGPELSALARRDAKAVIVAINDERLRFLQSLSTWSTFGHGWATRVAEVKAYSLQLAAGQAAPALPQAAAAIQKAGKGAVPVPAVRTIVSKGGGVAAVGAGSLVHWIARHPIAAVAATAAIGAGAGLIVHAIDAAATARQAAPMPNTPVVPELAAA